jgi:5'/3'-nucleotidase SurE
MKRLSMVQRFRVLAIAAAFMVVASLEAASAQVQVILTNDDGISAIGLQAVYDALQSVTGINVTVVAPAADASGNGFGFNATNGGTLNVTSGALLNDGVSTGYAVAGSPADCVRWALKVLFPGDVSNIIVVSGSNRGQNYGLNFPASGTVGGAGMATIMGVKRAIAVSQGMSLSPFCLASNITEFHAGAKFVANLVQALVDGDESVEKFAKNFEKRRVFLNINVPACGTPDGATVAKKLAEHAIVTTYTAGTPTLPTTPYTIGFDLQTVFTNTDYALTFDPKTDVGAVAINQISVATIELPRALRGGGKVDPSLLTGVTPAP